MTLETDEFLSVLKRTFGFDSFRPLQEEIIRDVLAGRDVFALLPTGGGKSLCFQLPALLRPGLTVVVSPLIALMKDQVNALEAAGVPATFLNSSLDAAASRTRRQGLEKGEYRLLYLAPERLVLDGTLADLKRWNVNLIAVDEAHCISEWGHDFRPEYRRLAELRDHFSDVPVMALTATATERVRDDIVRELRLREPARYVASFNRPNLTYRVLAKHKPTEQTLAFARARPGEAGIVYCQSRRTAESVSERLAAAGVKARPYHAGLAVMNERRPVTLTQPAAAPEPRQKTRRAGEITCDETLFDRLRRLRKGLADERNVPAYIVFSDVSLRQMASEFPSSERELLLVNGVGEKKLKEFGAVFLTEIAAYLEESNGVPGSEGTSLYSG